MAATLARPRLLVILAILGCLGIASTVGANITGGYISDKLISTGGSDSNLVISGASPGYMEIATVGTATPTGVSDITPVGATLTVPVTSLNSMPRALVYFQWSYDNSLSNTTISSTITSPQSVSLPLVANTTLGINYRSVVETDGIVYGSTYHFDSMTAPVTTSSSPWKTVWLYLGGLVLLVVMCLCIYLVATSVEMSIELLVSIIVALLVVFLLVTVFARLVIGI